MKILAIGSLPPPLGGTSISFQNLLDSLKENHAIEVRVINTAGIRGPNGFKALARFLTIILKLIAFSLWADVVTLHCSPVAIALLGPFVLAFSRIAGQPVIIRKFNGIDHMRLGPVKGKIAHFVVSRADLYLVQTKSLVKAAEKHGLDNVRWYPTNRPMADASRPALRSEASGRHFVFVGRVDASKGILEILAIDRQLPPTVTIDIYGPMAGGIAEKDFQGCSQVRYKGILPPDRVIKALARYHALLLPTYHSGEGYPGVIIEAYAAGIPVLCTRWLQLPEIVDETSGVLIPPKDPAALLEAIIQLVEDDERYLRLRAGAWRKRLEFSSERWGQCFVGFCHEFKK